MDNSYLFSSPEDGAEESSSVESAMKALTAQGLPPGLQRQHVSQNPTEDDNKSWVDGLRYRIKAEIEVSLDTTWSILPNFILTEITLRTRFAMMNNLPATVGIELDALFQYDEETALQVTGSIPKITENEDIDFILTIRASNTIETLPVYDFLEKVAGPGSSDGSLRLGKELEGSSSGQPGGGFAMAAQLTITRYAGIDGKEGKYFLKAVQFTLVSGVTLTLIPGTLVLTSVNFAFKVHREGPDDSFSTDISLAGKFKAGDAATLVVKGSVRIKDAVDINLAIAAGPMTGMRPETLFSMIMSKEGSSAALESARFPPTAKYPQQDYWPYRAELGIQRTTDGGWSIRRFLVAVECRDLNWKPIDSLKIQLKHISFHLYAARPSEKKTIGTSQGRPETDLVKRTVASEEDGEGKVIGGFRYLGSLQGVLILGHVPLSVAVTYDSESKRVTISGAIEDDVFVSMNEILQDRFISTWSYDANVNSNDVVKVSNERALPESCPVDLSLVDERQFGYRRRCTLALTESKVTRVRLIAEYSDDDVDWTLWSDLKATQMGLLVDIDRSAVDDKDTIIHLSAFGRFTFKNGLELFGVIDAAKSPDTKYFWLRLSASLGHNASIGDDPYKALSSAEFRGLDLGMKDWKLPSSAPSDAQPDSLIHSFHANLDVLVAQSTTTTGDNKVVSTAFSGAKLNMMVAGPWKIFEGFEINNFSVNLLFGSAVNKEKDPKEQDQEKQRKGLKLDVSSDMIVADLRMRLTASFTKVTRETTSFTLSLRPISSSISPQKMAELPMFGGTQVDERSKSTVPEEFPVKPQTLLATNGISAELLVTKESDQANGAGWQLSYLNFSLQNNNVWEIIDKKLRVTQSSLTLQIDKPKTKEKNIQFMASATFQVGGASVTGTLQILQQGERVGQLFISLDGRSATTQVEALTDTNITDVLSQSTLIDDSSDELILRLYLTRIDSYRLNTVQLLFNSYKGWELGPFTINHIILFIVFTEEGGKNVYFEGKCKISDKVATVSVLFVEGKKLVIKFRGSDITCTDLARQAGLQLPKVEVPDEVGLQDYENKKLESGMEATATLLKGSGGKWEADSLSFSITSTKQQWTLVPRTLWLSQMRLLLTIKDLQKDWKLEASIVATFSYAQRPPEMSNGSKDLTMTVTRELFTVQLDTKDCTLPQFVYIVTAGYLDLPDFVPKVFAPDTLRATVNWKTKLSRFEAIFSDWILPDFMKDIARMKEPRLDLKVAGWGSGGTGAEGWLRGTAVVLGVEVPLAYKLPNGPFTVFGIDIRRVWDLVKTTYQFLRSAGQAMAEAAEAAAAVVADLAAFAIEAFEMAEAALTALIASVEAALLACGVLSTIVRGSLRLLSRLWRLLTERDKEGHGGGSDDDDDAESRSYSNRDSSKMKESIAVSGTGISPGSPSEEVQLRIYPRGKGGRVWIGFDVAAVEVWTSVSNLTATKLSLSWIPIKNGGFETTYTRPTEKYTLSLHYLHINLQWVIFVEERFVSQLSPTHTLLRCPSSGLIQQPTIAEVYPRDQLGQPRFGLDKPESFAVSLVDGNNTHIPTKMVTRNDCFLIKYRLNEPGYYLLSVTTGGAPILSSPLKITALLGIDSRFTFARGEGVSSGLQNTTTTFEICFRDSRNQEYIPTQEEQAQLVVQLASATASTTSQILTAQFEQARAIVSYTRPMASSEPYTMDVSFERVPIQGSPYIFNSHNTAVSLDLKKSVFEVEDSTIPVRVGKPIRGLLRLKDIFEYDWRSPVGDCKLVWVRGPEVDDAAQVKIQDNGNGTYAVSWTFATAGEAKFLFTCGPDSTQEMTLVVGEAPVASNVLVSSLSATQMDLHLIDQYGDAFVWNPAMVKVTGYSSDNDSIPLQRVASGLKYAKTPQVLGVDFVTAGRTTPAMMSPYMLTGKPGSAKTTFLHQGPRFPPEIKHESISSRYQTSLIRTYLLVAMDEAGYRVYHGQQDIKLAWVDASDPESTDGVIVGLRDGLDGTYEIQVVCPTSSSAALQITMDGQPIAGSPYKLLSSENAWSSIEFTGEGWYRAILEEKSSFEMTFLTNKGKPYDQGVYNVSAIIFSPDYSFILPASISLQPGKAMVEYAMGPEVKPGIYFCRVFVNTLPVSVAPHEIRVEEAPSSADVVVSGLPETPAQASSLVVLQAEVEPNWTGTFEMLVLNVVSKRPLSPQIFTFQLETVDEKGGKSARVEFDNVEMTEAKFTGRYRAVEEGCVSFTILCFKKPVFTTRFWASDVAHSLVRQDPFKVAAKWPSIPLHNYGLASEILPNMKGTQYKKSPGMVAMLNRPAWLPGVDQTFPSGLLVAAVVSLKEGGTYEGFELLPFIRPSCNIHPILSWSKAHGFEWRQSFGHHRVHGRQLKLSSLNTAGPHTITIFWSVDPVQKLERLVVFDDGLLVSNFQGPMGQDQDERFWPQQSLFIRDDNTADQFELSFEALYTIPTLFRDQQPTLQTRQISMGQSNLENLQALFAIQPASANAPRAINANDFDKLSDYLPVASAGDSSPTSILLKKSFDNEVAIMVYHLNILTVSDPARPAFIKFRKTICMMREPGGIWGWNTLTPGTQDALHSNQTRCVAATDNCKIAAVLVYGHGEVTVLEAGQFVRTFSVAPVGDAFIEAENVSIQLCHFKSVPWVKGEDENV
ncbi:hypothetical protein F4803DRAFT_209000 [Xylaria telfairii]|nr:hypothetical protein F4803DRAFT_209000 [Xylaria telfairii]